MYVGVHEAAIAYRDAPCQRKMYAQTLGSRKCRPESAAAFARTHRKRPVKLAKVGRSKRRFGYATVRYCTRQLLEELLAGPGQYSITALTAYVASG